MRRFRKSHKSFNVSFVVSLADSSLEEVAVESFTGRTRFLIRSTPYFYLPSLTQSTNVNVNIFIFFCRASRVHLLTNVSKMQCYVPTCSSPFDQQYLWNCTGICNRQFHAACIGVKRGSEDDLQLHVLPICSLCRNNLHMEIDIRKIMQHHLEGSHMILTHIKTNDKTNQEALNELHNKIIGLQEEIKKSAEIASRILSAVLTQAPAMDFPLNEVRKAFEDTTSDQNQKLAESFCRIQEITSSHRDDIIKTIASAEKCPSDIILAVHDEVRALTSSINKLQDNEIEVRQKSLAEELNEQTVLEIESGWRLIGSKKIWKPDWTDFDARQRTRRLQEKEAEKARRRNRKHRQQIQHQQQQQSQQHHQQRRQQQHLQQQQSHQHLRRQQHQTNCNSDAGRNPSTPHFNLKDNQFDQDNASSSNFFTHSSTKLSDKELLDQARVEFSGQPPTTSNSNFINFRKGETINPYRKEKTPIVPPLNATTPQPAKTSSQTPEVTDSMFCLDPMKPPIVRLTEQSAVGDGRFLLARLREIKVYDNLRLYLAYLKDQKPDVCIDGLTLTSMHVFFASNGLPTEPEHLMNIFMEYNSTIGISPKQTLTDLETYRKYVTTRRLQYLQHSREAANKFYLPTTSSNFYKH